MQDSIRTAYGMGRSEETEKSGLRICRLREIRHTWRANLKPSFPVNLPTCQPASAGSLSLD